MVDRSGACKCYRSGRFEAKATAYCCSWEKWANGSVKGDRVVLYLYAVGPWAALIDLSNMMRFILLR